MGSNNQESLAEALKPVLELKEPIDTPARLKSLLSVSQYLNNHPVRNESLNYRIRYLIVLEYFVNEYSNKSMFSLAALHNYKQAFLGDDIDSYTYACNDLKSQINWLARTRFKSFKLFSNRFILAMDVAFLCALDDAHKGRALFHQIKGLYHSRYHAALDNLYDTLYQGIDPSPKLKAVYSQIQSWQDNINYIKKPLSTTLFVANMSAGKSTLINALIGKRVNRSLSQACTAKLHYVISKAFEDGYTYEYDYLLDLDASYDVLMTDNPNNVSNEIMVGTSFNLLAPSEKRLCFLDTPGANFSIDTSHKDISHWSINHASYDTLVFIFAAGTTGINDDFEYLHFIKDHHKDNCRLVFVFNKLDEYKDSEDSIDDSINKINEDLKNIGFDSYELYPVSASAGMMAKDVIQGVSFPPTSPEYFQYLGIKAHFNSPNFDCSKFYNVPNDHIDLVKQSLSKNPEEFQLLLKSGMLGLEYILTH